MFVLGCPDLLISVDHKPLVPIFNDRDLEKIRNSRLQKIREKTLPYQFRVISIPGTKNGLTQRILTTNISNSGSLDTNPVGKALLLHRNTPSPDIGASPAELIFARPINDHLPNPITTRKVWPELADAREKAFDRRRTLASKRANIKPARKLSPLSISDTVAIQNQTGQRWDRTSIISETLPHEQYRVLVDGSRRTTLRNRRFLRRILPHTRTTMEEEPTLVHTELLPDCQDDGQKEQIELRQTVPDLERPREAQQPAPVLPEGNPTPATPPETLSTPETPAPPTLRRSQRTKKLASRFDDYIMT